MRHTRGGIAHMAAVIEGDLSDRETGLHKPHLKGLADLAAAALACRSVNSSDWIEVLPREDCAAKSRERYISRWLGNELIDPVAVMAGFMPEVMALAGANSKTVILMLDQSKVSDGFEDLMVSLRVGERAIPVAWRVKATEGAIGFDLQKPLLDAVAGMVPDGVSILLSADRFYGTAALIGWCQKQGWQYRIRLKGDLILHHEGGEITTGDAAKAGLTALHDARLGNHSTTTHIGILHEQGHKEPWIIAMSEPPTKGRILDYGMRWGIECMFSDFKSRGFGLPQTQLKHAGRIERLILILAIATWWAVSTGMAPPEKPLRHTQKKWREA
jgi:hypothetical protein